MSFFDWLNKDWYLKLFDVLLFLIPLSIIGTFLSSLFKKGGVLKLPKNLGEIEIKNDNNEIIKISDFLKLKDEQIASLETSIEKFKKILLEKEEHINRLEEQIKILSETIRHLEIEQEKQHLLKEFEKQRRIPLIQHSIFFNLKEGMYGKNIALPFDENDKIAEIKVTIATAFLKCKMKVFYEKLKDFVTSIRETSDNPKKAMEILHTFVDNLIFWIDLYNKQAKTLTIELPNGLVVKGVPDIFIQEFNKWHDVHVSTVLRKTKEILYNDFYPSWELKTIVILDVLDIAFSQTLIDAQQTLLSLNGEFTKFCEQYTNY